MVRNTSGRDSTFRKIIENAKANSFQARVNCSAAQSDAGGVPRELRLEYQQALINYYWALRPLKENGEVSEWWDGVEPSEQWTREVETESDEAGSASDRAATIQKSRTVQQPVTGLDAIKDLNKNVRVVEETKHTMRGRIVDRERIVQALPFEILEDIEATLDDASNRLGLTIGSSDAPPDDDPSPW